MDCLPVQSFLNGGDLMPSKQVRAARVQLPVEGKTGHWSEVVALGPDHPLHPRYGRLQTMSGTGT